MKQVLTQVEVEHFQHFYPYTVAIVGAQAGTQANYMACAWHTAMSFEPTLFGVLIAKKRLTHQIVSKAGEFTANFISYEKVKLSAQMGRKSGHDMDKVKEFQVKLSPAKTIKSPILEEAYVAFECKVADIRTYGDHDLFVGEVVAIHHEEGAFNSEGVLDVKNIHPLLYLGSDFYVTIYSDTLKRVLPD